MLLADWIALAIIAVAALLGLLVGFGRGLKFFTSGIFGIIISIFVCYLILGFVLDFSFVQDWLGSLNDWLRSTGSVGKFFVDIEIGKVVAAVVLFIIVQIVRIIIVKIIKSIVEIENIVFKIINRILGIVFFVAVAMALGLVAMQIITLVGGETYDNVLSQLDGSVFKLDYILIHNPINSIFN